ncbi:MAG: hypothetical protein Q7R91_00035 [bacterium]|nr:hypothetical protein [bacterium]
MKLEWRFSEEQSHVFFSALWENSNNPRLKSCEGFGNITIWLETFKGGSKLIVAPYDVDGEFFAVLVEQELVRLTRYEADDDLPSCGCKVFTHRRALQQFRLKNLEP